MNETKRFFQNQLQKWSQKNLRKFPWRKPKIHPYHIFVAEFLLKRTTAKAASTTFQKFIKKYPTIKQLSSARKKEVEDLVRPIGYPQRAGEMISAAKFIVKNLSGRFPKEKKLLLAIPFVGDYLSSAVLSIAYNMPSPMVDSNVNRIISRVFFGKNPPAHIKLEIKKISESLVPKNKHKQFNFALLDVGGTICLPKDPKCFVCPLADICDYKRKLNNRYEK